MVILYDSKEKSNSHILQEFEKQGISYKKKALDTGDYTLMICACPELGFQYDTLFVDELCIERKSGLTELAGNLASKSDDGRIYKEFNRMINIEQSYLLIEDSSLDDIYAHNYGTKYNPDSFIRTLLKWQTRNNMQLLFQKKENMARTIYELCKSCLDLKILK